MPPIFLFHRSSWGCVSRRSFWLTVLSYGLLELFFLFAPLEIFYRLQVEPGNILVQCWIWVLLLIQWPIVLALYRLSLRRLRDAGFRAWWLCWALVPVVGWTVLIVLFLLPTSSGSPKAS